MCRIRAISSPQPPSPHSRNISWPGIGIIITHVSKRLEPERYFDTLHDGKVAIY